MEATVKAAVAAEAQQFHLPSPCDLQSKEKMCVVVNLHSAGAEVPSVLETPLKLLQKKAG